MANARLTWVLPTNRIQGEALPEAQIAFVEIQMSADGGANYSGLAQVPPPELEFLVADLNPGTYLFRGIVEDIDGRRSDAVDTSASILSVPSELPTFEVTIE